MAELQPNYMQAACTSAQEDRLLTQDLVCEEGIAYDPVTTVNALKVVADTGMLLSVGSGGVFVKGDDVAYQGMYHTYNAGAKAVSIPAADLVDPRIDLVVCQIRDSTHIGGVNNDGPIQVVQGTPLPSPSAPAVPPSAYALAEVYVGAGVTQINDVDITDLRVSHNLCAGPRTGEITMVAGNFAPVPFGWLYCDGSTVSRKRYARLFARIGTAFGSGDGSTTFGLPDMTGRFPVGYKASDTAFDTIGETGGLASPYTHTHTTPSHAHTLSDAGQAQITEIATVPSKVYQRRITAANWPATHVFEPSGGVTGGGNAVQTTGSALQGATDSASPGDTGSSAALPPYITIGFMIRT